VRPIQIIVRLGRIVAGTRFAGGVRFAGTPSTTLNKAAALAAAASTAFAMGPRKRGADFGDGLVEIFIQPRDSLLLFPEFFRARCRLCPAAGG
jgi:hypothetical protein